MSVIQLIQEEKNILGTPSWGGGAKNDSPQARVSAKQS